MSSVQVLASLDRWLYEGYGWRIQEENNHYVNILKYAPLRGSSYIKLPKELRNSMKGVVNIKNNDK